MTDLRDGRTIQEAQALLARLAAPGAAKTLYERVTTALEEIEPSGAEGSGKLARIRTLRATLLGEDGRPGVLAEVEERLTVP